MNRYIATLAVLVAGCSSATPPQAAAPPPTSPPVATAPAAPAPPPAWICASAGLASNAPTPQPDPLLVSDFRTTIAANYEGLSVTFTNGVPDGRTDVQLQNNARFILSPRGDAVNLRGDAGMLVTFHGTDMHTSFNGVRDIVAGGKVIAEARVVQDFEGTVQIALGLNGSHCYAGTFATSPFAIQILVRSAPYSSG